jgi:hypothetical protein
MTLDFTVKVRYVYVVRFKSPEATVERQKIFPPIPRQYIKQQKASNLSSLLFLSSDFCLGQCPPSMKHDNVFS